MTGEEADVIRVALDYGGDYMPTANARDAALAALASLEARCEALEDALGYPEWVKRAEVAEARISSLEAEYADLQLQHNAELLGALRERRAAEAQIAALEARLAQAEPVTLGKHPSQAQGRVIADALAQAEEKT